MGRAPHVIEEGYVGDKFRPVQFRDLFIGKLFSFSVAPQLVVDVHAEKEGGIDPAVIAGFNRCVKSAFVIFQRLLFFAKVVP